MKNLLLLLLCSITHSLSAQYISGLYTGKLLNDSTHKEQQYELALSEYRQEITGYAYTTFIVGDTFYYSIKKVSAKRVGNNLEVEDVKMLRHNFPQPPDKGVRQVMHIPLSKADTVSYLNGAWHTTATRQFYAIGGNLQLSRNNDSSRSPLLNLLNETAEKKFAGSSSKKQHSSIEGGKIPVAPLLAYNQRKQHLLQTINTSSDSLVVWFYDNGIVDGDTISVYLDGEQVIGNTKLKAAAAKHVIHLTTQQNSWNLMLVAENLGTIPPNTGLLVVQDGTQKYQVHFSADLQSNAVIAFKRNMDR